MSRETLFQAGAFKSHSGLTLPWKIDCDALTWEDWECLAGMVASKFRFRDVVGVPRGGIRFEAALKKYRNNLLPGPLLIVDDVLTTGHSMEQYRTEDSIGVVVFSRAIVTPEWIHSIFQLSTSFR